MRVRPARPRDALRLAHLRVASWHHAYRELVEPEALARTTVRRSYARFREQLGGSPNCSHGIRVLEHLPTGNLWGFVSIGPQHEPRYPYRGEIYELYVHPACQRQGIGRRLLSAGIWALVDRHLNPAMLWVLHDNRHARNFYARCGGLMFAASDARLGGHTLPTVAYGWPSTLPCPVD